MFDALEKTLEKAEKEKLKRELQLQAAAAAASGAPATATATATVPTTTQGAPAIATPHLSLINQLYQGQMTDYISCMSCGYSREHTDVYLDVSVDIGRSTTLEHALSEFVTPEILDKDNRWGGCINCKPTKVEARKGFKFLSLPQILCVQLKRFVYDPNAMNRVKLHSKCMLCCSYRYTASQMICVVFVLII